MDVNDFAAHSLRSGLSTSAAMMGMREIAIIKQTGHKTREMVDRYVQVGLRNKNNASSIFKNIIYYKYYVVGDLHLNEIIFSLIQLPT
jgi:integrase